MFYLIKLFLRFCSIKTGGFFLIGITLFVLTSACSPTMQPRYSTEIDVTMVDYGYQPAQWRVPAGTDILIHATNEGDFQHDWILLANPYTQPYDQDDIESTIFSLSVNPGESKTGEFKTPLAPGEYDVICGQPGHAEKGIVGKIIVIQP